MQATGQRQIHLSVAGRTDVGRTRSVNEDAFVVCDLTGGKLLDDALAVRRFEVGERGVLLAVADGIGGDRVGEVASALVVETLTRAMRRGPIDAALPTENSSDALMSAAMQRAHRAVWETAYATGRAGMGATLTAIFIHGATAYIAEVGDSRAYLLRAGRLTQLTRDPTTAQLLLDGGAAESDEIEPSPFRRMLVQALGHQRTIEVSLAKLELRRRDCFILCSDGLWTSVAEKEIQEVVLASPHLDKATDRLVELANERGGRDNITVIAAGVGGALPHPATTESVGATLEILESFDVHAPR